MARWCDLVMHEESIMNTRRAFLKSLASTLALPMLEPLRAASVSASAAVPLRLAYIYLPNGVNTARWFPQGMGKEYQLSSSLAPLTAHQKDFQIIRGLSLDKARANGDGAGDHARANATFLTGCQARKTAGADIRIGVSADQIAARQLGHLTRLPSLELSTDEPRRSGHCDSGYSCAYQFNLAWRSETTPAPPMRDPRVVFEAMFGSANEKGNAERIQRKKSVLDFVMEDAKRMQARATGADRNKLDEYFTSVREIEQRIERAEKHRRERPEIDVPNGVPETYREHIRAMYDLMLVAFQTDSTRVASFMLAHDGSNRTFPEIGINEAHHGISHHQRDQKRLEMIAKIDEFYAAELARFLHNMKQIREGEGNLLDHSMIVYGGGICDGDKHNHNDLPVLLAGHGGGALEAGRLWHAEEDTPLTNLHLALLDRMGVKAERVGDSTGRLAI
jgi:hypothetical protein